MSIAPDDLLFGFRPARWVWKPLVKRYLTGHWAALRMRPGKVVYPPHLERLGLYLHVPFCRRPCAYCPYNRVKFDEPLYRRYEEAAHQEIDLVAGRLEPTIGRGNGHRPAITSLYVGGGTPTMVPGSLADLLAHAEARFGRAGDVCVELHPSAMDEGCLDVLQAAGVTMVSVGVESLSDRLLGLIGRSHDAATAEASLRRAVDRGFDTVSADLMFALPTQSLEELDRDLVHVLDLGVDQISCYPIFGFPYTELGRRLGLNGLCRPPGDTIRRMLALIRRRTQQRGLVQNAVWSFGRPIKKKFTSTTRHHYLGIGPGAASMIPGQFCVNTFSIEEYAAALPGRQPVALVLPVSRRLEMAYWLYWRAYEMKIPRDEFSGLFGEALETVFGPLMRLLVRSAMAYRENGCYCLTERAAYWIHRVQNEYALNYITRLWGRCRREAWPEEVKL